METSYSLLLFDNDKTVGKATSKSIIHTVLGPWVQIFKGSKIDFGVISTDPHLIFEMTLWSCLKVNRGELWRQGGALVNFLEHWDIYIYHFETNPGGGFRAFTTLCYSADGKVILAGGLSKNVCIYSVKHQLLMKKFEISCNHSLDGMEVHSW